MSSLTLRCCLCFTSFAPSNEHKLLQNELGESNEIYEITVKYFDPMLLTEGNNTKLRFENKLLCQECWLHINDFHEFQQTVLRIRANFEELDVKQLPLLEVKVEDELSVLCEDGKANEKEDDNEMDMDVGIKDDVETNDFQDFPEDSLLINEDDDEDDDDKPLMELKQTKLGGKEKKNSKQKLGKIKKIKYKVTKNKKPGSQIRRKANSLKEKVENTDSVDESGLKDDASKNENDIQTPEGPEKEARIIYCKKKCIESDAAIAKWKTSLECDLCQETYPNFDTLRTHFREKHKTKCYIKCCERKFYRRYVLVQHIEVHLNPTLHKCEMCDKIFASNYNLKLHNKVVHQPFEPIQCHICHKLFKQKLTLERHLLTHETGDKDFICGVCGKGFVAESLLKAHNRNVHNVDRVCDQCGKTIHGKQTYERHLMEHAGIDRRKFPCDVCGAKLKSNENLRRHKEAYHNDGSTIYVCSVCGKVATSKTNLKDHKKNVHEAERRHKCTYCDKAFKTPQTLREHIATHTGQDLYQCPHCPQTFKVSANMHHHRKKVHPVEWLEARKSRLQVPKLDMNQIKTQVVI